jgi:hypothetical protein
MPKSRRHAGNVAALREGRGDALEMSVERRL